MTNTRRRSLRPLIAYAVATATVATGLVLGQGDAHAEPLCTTDADCAALGYTGQADPYVTEDKIRLYSDRYELASDDAADPVADCLLDRGYRGLAGDGLEAIYAPRDVIEACAGSDV